MKGSANLMLRANQKRKRTHQECVDQKAAEDEERLLMNDRLDKLQKLEEANERLRDQVKDNEGAHLILNDLRETGRLHLDDQGQVFIPGVDDVPQ